MLFASVLEASKIFNLCFVMNVRAQVYREILHTFRPCLYGLWYPRQLFAQVTLGELNSLKDSSNLLYDPARVVSGDSAGRVVSSRQVG